MISVALRPAIFTVQTVKMKIISLLNVGNCESATDSYLSPTDHTVEVLRVSSNTPVETIQCLIVYDLKVNHCHSTVFRSDIYPEEVLLKQHVHYLSNEQCLEMYRMKSVTITIQGTSVQLSKLGASLKHQTVSILGSRTSNGDCVGAKIRIGSRIFDSAVVTAEVSSKVRRHVGLYSLESQKIVIPHLISVDVATKDCDSDLGCFGVDAKLFPPFLRDLADCMRLNQEGTRAVS